eukprot:1807545-Pyramimonas_sp.AAC.1
MDKSVLCLRGDNQPFPSVRIHGMYDDASSSKIFPGTPCNLKCPDPPLVQGVAFSTAPMMDACHAGAPAGGSDGSWKQAQSGDVTGSTPTDTLCANDPWRAHVQQLP